MESFLDESGKKPPQKLSWKAKALLTITGGLGIGISIVCIPFVSPALRKHCLPFVPATNTQIFNVLSLVQKNSNNKLLDIGSGDGRIVIEAALKCGMESHGVELNPWLVWYSRLNAWKQNAWSRTKFFRKNLWNFPLSSYDYIVIFGVEKMMGDIETKITQEAQSGSKVIACRFPLPNLTPEKIIGSGVDTVWLYKIKKK